MARTLVTVQAELDAILAAKASGALRVKFADRDTTFRSLDEMDRIIGGLENELAVLNGVVRTRAVQIIGVKGL